MNIENITANFQLIGTRIANLTIDNEFASLDPNDESVSREIDVSYDVSSVFTVKGPNDDELMAQNIMMYIRLKVFTGELQANINLDLEGCYIFDGEDKNQLHEMIAINGTATLYSIARGMISSITSHMCANGTLLLPMINVFKLRDGVNKQNNK